MLKKQNCVIWIQIVVYIKRDDIYKDILEDVETRFNIWSYDLERSLPKRKKKNLIGLIKDKLGGKFMAKFVGLRTKAYSYLIDDSSEDKKAVGRKKCAMKRKLRFENYKNSLEASQADNKIKDLEKYNINTELIRNNKWILKIQQSFKSKGRIFFTEELNKITLSSSDDKIMPSIDLIEKYAYGTSKDLVSEKEKIKCNNIIRQYKNWLNLMKL